MSAAKRTRVVIPSVRAKKAKLGVFALTKNCLSEIFSYLPLKDVISVRLAHQHFKEGVRLRYAKGLKDVDCIDPAFIQRVPNGLFPEFIEFFGKGCRSIKLKLLPADQFWKILSKFSNLDELSLSEITLNEELQTMTLPVALKSFELDRCKIQCGILDLWIPNLIDTLTTLRVTCQDKKTDLRALKTLDKISTFVALGMTLHYPELLVEILARNRDSLTNLTLISKGDDVLGQTIWRNIIQLDNLTHIHLNQRQYEDGVPEGLRLFPNLASLQVSFSGQALKIFLGRLACEKSLQSLIVQDYGESEDVAPFKRFRNLHHLELPYGAWSDTEVRVFAKLPLRSLDLNSSSFNRSSDVILLIQKIPSLRKLNLENIWFWEKPFNEDRFEKRFQAACKKHPVKPFDYEMYIADM